MSKLTFVPRDLSWLSFNARVLQEAADQGNALYSRIRFLGIFSNNMDEFFRVRVATLKRMAEFGEQGKRLNMHLENSPAELLKDISNTVINQQKEFDRIWALIQRELRLQKVFIKTDRNLLPVQKKFVIDFFEKEVRSNIIPLMIESLPELPYLREKSIYLGVVMQYNRSSYKRQFSLIEVPTRIVGRFIHLPSPEGQSHIILLEDIIRFNLPYIFSYFGYDHFEAHLFKVTKDAEIDLDNDISTSLVEKMQKGLKGRRKGKPVRFVYDKEMNTDLLNFLIRKLYIDNKSSIIPGGRIHNFRHFMDFPNLFGKPKGSIQSLVHPTLKLYNRVTDAIVKRDVMLHFPYHSFSSVIDLLREAAIDPDVVSIKITAYRLASESKVINALINASRNGKKVIVMLELRARFDEEANLMWKSTLEDEGVKVLLGVPNMKVHAKLCVIKKRIAKKTFQYGFVSTGNLNEKTASVYSDHCLLTANKSIMADINRIFDYLEHPNTKRSDIEKCTLLLVSPFSMRKKIEELIDVEIHEAKRGRPASITLKLNSLSDQDLIKKLYQAVECGVKVNLIIRSIFCAQKLQKKAQKKIHAVSIVDQYLEHARVMAFYQRGKLPVYISSADWMVRNLDHRVEAAVPVIDLALREELLYIMDLQLRDNVKARILNPELSNRYVVSSLRKDIRSQHEIFKYIQKKSQSDL